MGTDSRHTFLVTGGSGYLAGWIIKYLLDDGHRVRATVRDKNNRAKVAHLMEIASGARESFALFEADLLRPGSFDEAVQGCDFVIHTASPFFIQGIKNSKAQLIGPALEGTRNVLGAVNAASSVKRVVLTSSCVAVMSDPVEIRAVPGGKCTEAVWNTTADEKHHPYAYSKTLAEQEAWRIAEQQDRWSLVTVNPGFAIGPSLSKRIDSTSIQFMIDLFSGKFKTGILNMYMGFVDVRDAARAHILAALKPEASGRHLLVADTLSYLAFVDLLRKRYAAAYPLPKRNLPAFLSYMLGPFLGFSWKMLRGSLGIPFAYDNAYAKQDLGVTFRPLEETAADHIDQLIRDGLLKRMGKKPA